MQINVAESLTEIEACFPVILQLRPTLTQEEFIKRVTHQQKEGYKLVFLEYNSKVISVIGFKIMHTLVSEKVLYVDDFITDEAERSKGFGGKLFDWIIEYAKKEKCNSLQLDSGLQRKDAHRFYENKGLQISSHHFLLIFD